MWESMPTMPALKERKKGKTVWAIEWDAFAKKKLLIILRQLVEFKEIFANYMHNKVAQASSDSL